MQSLTAAFNSFSHTIKEAINPTTAPAPRVYTRADILLMEEAERERRMHDTTALERKAIAAKASSFISSLQFPYFRGSMAGSKRFTARAEEHERARRLLTKPELALRKANANRTAGMIRSLGWPFIRTSEKQGPVYVFADETSLLAEEERLYRIHNPLQAQLAKNNAALASNALRWGWTGLPLGTKRYTRNLEEKERARRLTDREELSLAAEKAYQIAGVIRNLGYPFYVQNQHVDTVSLEQEEQRRRLSDKLEQVKARQHAAIVSRLLPMWAAGKSVQRAEQERSRRMSAVGEQQQAMQIAKQLSTIVAGSLLDEQEENERSRRMRHAEFDAARAREVANLIQGLQFSKANANSLYNREAHRRLRDILTERVARQNAHKVASLVSAQPGFGLEQPIAANVAQLEEDERKQRMYDWNTQQNQMRNARKASDMIKAFKLGRKQSPYFQMEKERHRRMVDAGQQAIAMANAKQVSNMLRGNSTVLRKAPARSAAPLRPLASPAELTLTTDLSPAFAAPFRAQLPETAPLLRPQVEAPLMAQAMAPVSFFPEVSLPRDAPADFMPPAETLREALPFQGELLDKTREAPGVLPFKGELLQAASARPESVPRQALPFKEELLASGPSQLRSHLPQQPALPFRDELLSAGHTHLRPRMLQQELPFKDELLSTGPSQLRSHLPQQPQLPFAAELLASGGPSQLRSHLPQQQALPFKDELLSRGLAELPQAAPLQQQQQQSPQQLQSAISSMPVYGHAFLPELKDSVSRAAPIEASLSSSPVTSVPLYGHSFLPELKDTVPKAAPTASSAPLASANPSAAVASMPLYGHSFLPELKDTIPKAKAAPISAAPIAPIAAAPLASAPLASAFTPVVPSAPLASAPLASAPLASAPLASAPLASAPLASAPLAAPLSSAPLAAAPLASAPLASAPLASAPLASAPLSSAPLASTNPFVPAMGAPLPSSLPLSATPTATAAPISAVPLAAPLSKPPMGSAPILSAPLLANPTGPSNPLSMGSSRAAPLYSGATLASPALASAVDLPYAAPVNAGTLLTSMASSSPALAPGLGLSSSTISAPLYGTSTVASQQPGTFYSAAGAHVLTDQQRRRLDKQAQKHTRKAAKDNARAEKLLQKAEKLHMRGKDARAEKKENKAEQKVISSKQHALWANDLLHKQQSALNSVPVSANGMMIQPGAAPVYRPAM